MRTSFKAWLCFITRAVQCRSAYIDMDGCLLRAISIPAHIPPQDRLIWWLANIRTTTIVRRRLPLLYVLRAMGVRLYVWTNRPECLKAMTWSALGVHRWLFSGSYFMAGQKRYVPRAGPCIDDEARHVDFARGDLLVASIGVNAGPVVLPASPTNS